MIGRARHLQEDRIFECYVAERSGDVVNTESAAHLSACGECRARYVELSRFMDGLRAEADAETDDLFTPHQLRLQQQQILRRIEHLGQPARVISFPGRLMRRHLTSTAMRIAPRWAAAAAAAGLFVGVGVGVFFDSRTRVSTLPITAQQRPAPPVASPPPPVVDDDAFLSELEAALGRPYNQELLPFDALTPRVHEISSRPLRY